MLFRSVDPELGIDVVNLGLLRDVNIDPSGYVTLAMTLTSAACPLDEEIKDQVRSVLDGHVTGHAVNFVYMPPWHPEDMTPEGVDMLRALGYNV